MDLFKDEEHLDSMLGGMSPSLNLLAIFCRDVNDKWWRDPVTKEPITRNDGELLMLMVSEISEAMEAHRKNAMDDKLPHRKGLEVELVDCLIRIFDYAGEHKLDLTGAFNEKIKYNLVRKDHSFEERVKPGGKKY